MDYHSIAAVCALITFLTVATECRKLDDYILHYEELLYDTDHVHASHLRHKRSIDKEVHINLDAFDRTFKLRLKRDSSMFSPDMKLEFMGKTTTPDLSFLYSGELHGHPGSRVHGAILEGIFRGSFEIPSEAETYHVEKSHRFFENKPVFHSVIYKESDMEIDPFKERREKEMFDAQVSGTCGLTNARAWMREVVQSEHVQPNRANRTAMEWQEIHTGDHNKYSQGVNAVPKPADVPLRTDRQRRAIKNTILGTRNTCIMSLTSDKFFWEHYLAKSGGNAELAKDEILAFFGKHIDAINSIFDKTTFNTYDNDYSYSGFQFAVQKTKVMTPDDCTDNTSPYARFCQDNVDVSNFLNINSLINHDEFCLAYVFTYRDFSQGTLGLAWVGSSATASGGMCEKNKVFTEKNNQVRKSLNTGIVTTINYGKEVPSKVSQLTFTHEVGHNFGSPHDSGAICAPYGTGTAGAGDGNYIMFASATMGDKPHNSQFSTCSRDNITRVVHAVINQQANKVNCLKESGKAFCGNGLVEGDEECDCGYDTDCTDKCCQAKNSLPNNPSQECKLKKTVTTAQLTYNVVCSPSQGPCCTSNNTCQFIGVAAGKKCRVAQDCAAESYCGANATCPPSNLKPDGSYCNNYGFTCTDGECGGSLCARLGWVECFKVGTKTTTEELEKLCKLGCKPNDTSTECILSSDAAKVALYSAYQTMVSDVTSNRTGTTSRDPANGVQLAAGSPCNNFQGYCDVFYRCRGVDAEGPLSRLKNLIFDPQTLQDISNWIVVNWWAVLLIAIGLILAMGLFIKFCAVHTPSSNPKAKPARKLSETMTLKRRRNQNRALPPQPQQTRYPQNSRSKDKKSGQGSRSRDYYPTGRDQELLSDPKYPAKNPQGPPPPYPGSSSQGSHLGPPHGHGKKGKARRAKDMEMGRV